MNYIETFLAELGDQLPDCDAQLLRYYALLGIVKGTGVTLQDIHDAWAVWANDSPALTILFRGRMTEVQEWDVPYRDAVTAVARKLSS